MTAFDADVQVPTATFTADLGREYELESWSTEAEIATDLPEQIREAPGYAVASGSVTLAPPEDAGPGHFSPFRTGLRLANRPCALTAGFEGDEVPVFAGKLVGGGGSARDEKLPLRMEDNLSNLRGQVSLPAIVHAARYGPFLSPWIRYGISTRWAMDTILRSAGYYTTPAPEPRVICSVPLQDSTYPEPPLAANEVPIFTGTSQPVFADASWGRALFNGYVSLIHATRASLTTVGETARIACLTEGSSGTATVDFGTWSLVLTSSTAALKCEATGTTRTLTVAPGALVIDLERTSSTVVTARVRQPSATDQVTTFAVTSSTAVDLAAPEITAASRRIAGVQLAASAAGVSTTLTHVPSTDLDPCLGRINAVPVGLTGSKKDTLREIAEAELGAFWISPSNVATFRNRNSLRGIGVPVETVTSYDKLSDLSWSFNSDAVRSAVEVPVSPARIQAVPLASGSIPIYTADTIIRLPAGQRVVLRVDLEHSVSNVYPHINALSESDSDPGVSYFRCYSNESGEGGTTIPEGATGTARMLGPSRLEITLIGGAYDLWLYDRVTGDPALTITANLKVTQPEAVIVRTDNTGVDADVLTLPENRWRQDAQTAQILSAWLAALVQSPVPVLQSVEVVPDPRRQLAAVIKLEDPSVTGLNKKVLVVGINRSGSGASTTERLSVREIPWTIGEVTAANPGQSVGDFNAHWSGYTVGDFNTQPLGRTD